MCTIMMKYIQHYTHVNITNSRYFMSQHTLDGNYLQDMDTTHLIVSNITNIKS